jgi:hypothetical protein
MKFGVYIVVAIAGFAAVDSATAFSWPWERHRPRTHHQRRVVPVPLPPLALDCAEINAAVRALDPAHLARALRKSNPRQRKTIEECRARE